MSLFKKLGIALAGAVGIGLLAKGVKNYNEDLQKIELEQKRREEEYQKQRELEELEQKRREEENRKRENMPCYFNDGISYIQFVSIVERITKPIKRLSVSIDGPIIYGTVRSQSGISTWDFTLDFNDWGHITGTYWRWRENIDSDIPDNVGDQIQKEIKKLL